MRTPGRRTINAFGWGIVVGYVAFRIEQAQRDLRILRHAFGGR